MYQSDFIFVISTETWLNDYFYKQIYLNNYNCFKCDRSIYTSVCNRVSGVLIAIQNDVPVKVLPVPVPSVEHFFIII